MAAIDHPFMRDVPTLLESEVLVVGGGPAGVGAAVTAARRGARVTLLEAYGFLGGTLTAALLNEFGWREGKPGLPAEVIDRLISVGGTLHCQEPGGVSVKFAPEAMKYVLDQIAVESGIQLLLHAPVCAALVERGQVRGVVAATKSGCRAIRAAVTVDATGDGDVAAFAGASFEKGRPSDGGMSAPTLVFRMGNVDVEEALSSFRQEREIDGTDLAHVRGRHLRGEPIRVYELSENMLRIAREKGVSPNADQHEFFFSPRHPDLFHTTPLPGVVVVNMAQVPNVDMTDPLLLSEAEVFARRQIRALVDFLTAHVPGFQRAYLIDSGPHIGIRETRRIIGDYVLTEEDRFDGRRFEDGVVSLRAFVDIHSPDGRGTYKRSKPGVRCTLPYRCLLPRGLDGILTAGRCVSATVAANIKGVPTCMVIGQAAGAAAALSVRSGQSPRSLDAAQVRASLSELGFEL